MREAHPLDKRVAETLNIGDDEDLFGHDQKPSAQSRVTPSKASVGGDGQPPNFGDALLGLLGSTTAGSAG